MIQPAEADRSEYYRDYWKVPELGDTEHLRWKAALTQHHPRVLAARSVLDVGCGTGRVLDALKAPGLRLCGVEAAGAAIEALESRGLEGRTVDLETGSLPFADGEFDVVLCYDVLEHLFAPGRILREIRRVMGRGGLALLCVPNTLNLFNRLVFLGGRFVDVMDTSHHREDELFSNHIRLFSKKLFERFIAANGLRITERHYYFPARFSDSRFKLLPSMARLVTAPRLHERWPELFALGFLYACEREGDG
jgi:SAM-dependent methyltransferase